MTMAMILQGKKQMTQISERAYARMTNGGEGLSHQEHQAEKVSCDKCGKIIGRGRLEKHQQTATCKKASATKANPQVEKVAVSVWSKGASSQSHFAISLPKETSTPCPVDGCPYKTPDRRAMQCHFRNRHCCSTICIIEEGLLPQCRLCGIIKGDVGLTHQATADCKKHTQKRQKRLQATANRSDVQETVFTVNGTAIKMVKQFKYLGRMLDDNDSDLPAVEQNLIKARKRWGMIGRILKKRKSTKPKTMATFYKVIVQSLLLFGSESWVLSTEMHQRLESFHRRCAHSITGQYIRQ
jgi:hypothetical protein